MAEYGNFEELPKFRDDILQKLIQNSVIVQALSYNDEDFCKIVSPKELAKIQNDPSREDEYDDIQYEIKELGDKLLYNRIFPYRYRCGSDDESATYITFGCKTSKSILPSNNKTLKKIYIWFTIYCKYDLVKVRVDDETKLRFDCILIEIDKMLNKQKLDGTVNGLEIVGHEDVSIYEGRWHGCQVGYELEGLNVPYKGLLNPDKAK